MDLLYFSPVPARSYAQRPHFCVRALLELGIQRVLWVDPYPQRLPRWSDVHRARTGHDHGTTLDPRIDVLEVPALPIEPLPGGVWVNQRLLWPAVWQRLEAFAARGPLMLGIGCPSALALAALERLQPTASFYDAMDDFPEFHRGLSRWAMRRRQQAVVAGVDLVLTSSTYLARVLRRSGRPVEKVLNACQLPRVPRRLAPRAAQRPVLGYVGCLGSWFDWELTCRLAEAVPEMTVELIGPLQSRPPRRLPGNISLQPPCSHERIAGHLATFSAGLIPFRANRLTAGVDPIKYYDYRACGLPVLSTRFGEMALRGAGHGVSFLDPDADLRRVVLEALATPPDWLAAERFRHANGWQRRFAVAHRLRGLIAPQRIRVAA